MKRLNRTGHEVAFCERCGEACDDGPAGGSAERALLRQLWLGVRV